MLKVSDAHVECAQANREKQKFYRIRRMTQLSFSKAEAAGSQHIDGELENNILGTIFQPLTGPYRYQQFTDRSQNISCLRFDLM